MNKSISQPDLYKYLTHFSAFLEVCTIIRQPNSLYLRLLLPLGAALLLAMVAAWAIALTLLTNVMNAQLDAKLTNATETLADASLPFTPELMQRFDRLLEARIVLLDAYGAVQLSTGDERVNSALGDIDRVALEVDGVRPTLSTVDAGDLSWRVAAIALPSTRDDRFRYVVAAASITESQAATKEAALLLGAAMSVAAIALALLGAYFLRSITQPVANLAVMANRIAAGERNVKIDIDERNEIGMLAQSFNEMAARLDIYESELAITSRLSGLGDLASRMAHEIRNPLTAMKMQLELLEERTTETDLVRVRKLLDEVRRLEMIVDNALAVGGSNSVNPAPGNVAILIADIVELLRPTLSHRGIELIIDVADTPTLALDKHRIKQVLLNLINNAADELSSGGTIAISAQPSGAGFVEIAVEDSGPGLGEHEERSTKPLGLGLGLKISSEIVERHGGELISDSSEQLGGAKFTMRLPVSIMAEAAD